MRKAPTTPVKEAANGAVGPPGITRPTPEPPDIPTNQDWAQRRETFDRNPGGYSLPVRRFVGDAVELQHPRTISLQDLKDMLHRSLGVRLASDHVSRSVAARIDTYQHDDERVQEPIVEAHSMTTIPPPIVRLARMSARCSA